MMTRNARDNQRRDKQIRKGKYEKRSLIRDLFEEYYSLSYLLVSSLVGSGELVIVLALLVIAY